MSKKNIITNTAKEAAESPVIPLMEAMIQGPSNAIEAQEARGQQELVVSEVLPAEGVAEAEKLGCKILGPVEGDPLFVHAELPPGWSKRATNHSMHTDLVDEKGRARGGIFYKAAFYDRRAFFRLLRRYSDGTEDHPSAGDLRTRGVVTRDGEAVWTGPWREPRQAVSGMCRSISSAYDDAEAWLNEHRPEWRDPLAYWDEP